ncbi:MULTISPECIES: Asp23/Gls24 family envelope stress response protein [unclassified Rathayibacter]|uniref:Asp23/Gls24 family envelope stress response protein n=1 Tax=unclassified Rathayibacter TaxID=2609250 RepID=UPI000F4B0C8A|nr:MULTISPECIES: Asp23/Gls24 family envelope stress response protein [unclassified Rathayibacter]MCJ1703282.1 Asp23/Gls24 family envelope stress response protein [Rathayibacter sp. VKM Ac-2926]ROP56570.1 putative alkaline shock family protein YloU [Rathayibacter sp. PhB186]ROS54955.1 putative alkaline shock family protein YloU [Rathayibacter sp. PhB185]
MTNVTPSTVATTTAKHGTETSTGKNTIADGVVEKVAGIAARQVAGVHDLGGGAARAIGAIRNAINAQDRGQGISVEVGEKQVAADITVVAEYPVALQKLADSIRSAVSEAISSVVGMEVTEVNVTIADVYIPSDDKDEDTESRVK